MPDVRRPWELLALTVLTLIQSVTAQTYSNCNPLTQGKSDLQTTHHFGLRAPGSCPADPALGGQKNIAFTSGQSTDFTTSGAVTYDANGAAFTVARSGDSPTLTSKWYIMFGHVDFVVKAAPGQGIVSSAILQSDCLDEIDWEWIGGDDSQAQSNYFGKGQTTTGYNRGAFHGMAGNHDTFNTYSIDWTADQIVWSINGQTVRAMTQAQAEPGQYPQTPMAIKVGVWAGGDPANAPGTIAWAGGPVDYTAGPFTMYVKAIAVTDYSTGSAYSYDGTTGTWQSIRSTGGTINSNGDGHSIASVTNTPNLVTASGVPTVPFSTDSRASSIYATRTGYPWVPLSATAVTTVSNPTSTIYTAINGLPSGWTISADGKVHPPVSSAVPNTGLSFLLSSTTKTDTNRQDPPTVLSSSASSSAFPSSGLEQVTVLNCQGLPTVITISSGATVSKSFDVSGCPVYATISTGPDASPDTSPDTSLVTPPPLTASLVVTSTQTHSLSSSSHTSNPDSNLGGTGTAASNFPHSLILVMSLLSISLSVQRAYR